MDFFDVLRARRSVRTFSSRPIEAEKLQRILEAANSAPSAGNQQSYEIYTVQPVKKRAALSQAAGAQGFVLGAPLSLVFCAHPARAAEYGERGERLFAVQDATIACAFAMLAAAAQGVGSVWTGAFDPAAVRRVLGAPEDLLPVAILPLGYAAGAGDERTRRPLEELVHPV